MPTERVFEFYDRYGIPLEFMEQRWEDEGITFDREEFEEAMEAYRAKAREGGKMGKAAIVFKREFLSEKALDRLHRENFSTEFVGYESTEAEARVLAIFTDDESAPAAAAGAEAQVILDRTPFYARSGGQVGDVGRFDVERRRGLRPGHDPRPRVHRAPGEGREGPPGVPRAGAGDRRRGRAPGDGPQPHGHAHPAVGPAVGAGRARAPGGVGGGAGPAAVRLYAPDGPGARGAAEGRDDGQRADSCRAPRWAWN